MDRSSSGRSQKLRGKITAQTRSTNDLIAPISAATSKSAGVQILSNYAPECCISSESFPAPPDVPGITGLVAGNRYMDIYFNLFSSVPGVRALPILGYEVQTTPLTDPTEIISPVRKTRSELLPVLNPFIRVENLINGRNYRFTLYAVNALGLSSGSSASIGGSGSNVAEGTPAGPPSVPRNVLAEISGANAVVTFTDPSDNGGATIQYYTVSIYNTAGTNIASDISGTRSPIIISGLTASSSYKFKVSATNKGGVSPLSDFTDTITFATVPDAPIITSVTRGNGQLIISYTAPVSDGGSLITGYKYSSNGGTSYTLTTDTDGSLTISPLANGTPYNIVMKAVNAIGDSVASNIVPGTPSLSPPSVPNAPLLVRTLADDGKAYIYFAPQDNGGSTILKYQYSVDNGASYNDYTLGSILSPLLITNGLTNEQPSTVLLKAVNSVGESAESNAMTVTPTGTSTAATASLWLDPTDVLSYTLSGTAITAAKLKTGGDPVLSTSVGSGVTYDGASASGVFDFNGITNSAVINFPIHNFGSTITVTAWINPRVKHSINGLIANGTAWGGGTSGQGFRFQWNWWVSPATSSSRTIQSQVGALITSTTPPSSNLNDDHSPTDIIQYNVWQHVGYQLDTINNTIIFFYNGVPTLITTDGITPSPITMAGLPFVIGGLRGSYTMNAKLGDLKVFDTLLDATQIKAEFDATKARFGLT